MVLRSVKVAWLPVNGCYAVVYGDQLVAIEEQYLWTRRDDLVAALGRCGLFVNSFDDIIPVDSTGNPA